MCGFAFLLALLITITFLDILKGIVKHRIFVWYFGFESGNIKLQWVFQAYQRIFKYLLFFYSKYFIHWKKILDITGILIVPFSIWGLSKKFHVMFDMWLNFCSFCVQILVIKRPGHSKLIDFCPTYMGDRHYAKFSSPLTAKRIFLNFVEFGQFNF